MNFAEKLSEYNRKRKWEIFLHILKPTPGNTILDVGFTENEYSLSDNFLEKHYPYPDKITALGIDMTNEFSKRYPLIRVVKYEGKHFPFNDKQFDICWSNAVIEHVGKRDEQILFLKEIKRVARSAFVTTPNRLFPFEVHTRIPLVHYMPKNAFDKFLCAIGKNWATGNYMNLLSLQDLKSILAEAGISNYKIIKNRLVFFTVDFVIIF